MIKCTRYTTIQGACLCGRNAYLRLYIGDVVFELCWECIEDIQEEIGEVSERLPEMP